MPDENIEYDITKDIEFYLKIRDIVHNIVVNLDDSEIEEEKELKRTKLLLDIGDKAIQNRIKLLVQIGRLDIELDENEGIEPLLELLDDEEIEE